MNLSELDFNNAGDWPSLAKLIAVIVVFAAVAGAGYYFFIGDKLDQLDVVQRNEQQLRKEFVEKQKVMANIDAYRLQIDKMQETLDTMLGQLPTGTEMPDLLEDISNTGRRNGLFFELFKPESEQPREFYAAKPISIRARANYHQFGAFVSNIAALSRIVTLENASLIDTATATPSKRGATPKAQEKDNKPLLIEATLQTYRYLEEDKAAESAAESKPKPKPKPKAAAKE